MMRFNTFVTPLSALTLLLIGACGSDSPEPDIVAQAIDGYIVDATVFCDGVEHGRTGAAGRLTCPSDTRMITVQGGADVGFDRHATSGDILFVGELSAPAHLGYVTPLSTLAVVMSSDSEGYDESKWAQSVSDLAATLSQSSLDLSADAAEVIQLIKLNAQINQLIVAYSETADDYREVTEEVAGLMKQRAQLGAITDLQDGLANTMAAVNGRLQVKGSALAQSESELDVSVLEVQAANSAIAGGETAELVAMAATGSIIDQAAVTIDRGAESVGFTYPSYWDEAYIGGAVSLEEFENPVISSGTYRTVVNRSITGVQYDNRVLQFNKSFTDARVSMAFEIKSLDFGDRRSLSFSTSDVSLSAMVNDASSLVLTMPENATFRAHGTDRDGSTTTTEIRVDEAATFSSSGGSINVGFADVNQKLKSLGFRDILETEGNFQMTMVISGLHINERLGTSVTSAKHYTIGTGATRITGTGFQGYVTITRY